MMRLFFGNDGRDCGGRRSIFPLEVLYLKQDDVFHGDGGRRNRGLVTQRSGP